MLNPQINNARVAAAIRVAALVMALLLVVPDVTGALSYGYDAGFVPIQPRYYLAGLVALLAVYALFNRPRLDLSVLPLLALITVRLGDAFFLHRVPDLDQAVMLSAEAATLAYSLGMIFLCGDHIALRRSALLCGSLAILVCAAANAYEWHAPGCFGIQRTRPGGMLHNPNASADAIAPMLGLVLSMTPPLWLAAGVIGSAGIGIYFTLSRGGAIVWLLTVVAYLVVVAHGRWRRILGFAFWLAIIILPILKIATLENPVDIQADSSEARDIEIRKRELSGQDILEASDSHRMAVLLEALQGVKERPILGYGTGASLSTLYMPHNELIAVWLDNGIVGMMLYALGLCLLVGRCILKNKVLLIGCIPLIGLMPFSQNLAEEAGYLSAWIVLCGMLKVRSSRFAVGYRHGWGPNAVPHHDGKGRSEHFGGRRWLPAHNRGRHRRETAPASSSTGNST